MENNPEPCSKCGADTRKDRAAGLTYCSGCGSALTSQPTHLRAAPIFPSDTDDTADRRRWKQCFWLAFFLTPVAPFVAGMGATLLMRTLPGLENKIWNLLVTLSVIGVFAAGTFSSSYCLLRIRNEHLTRSETLAHMVVYAFGMVAVYGGILFVGCCGLSVVRR